MEVSKILVKWIMGFILLIFFKLCLFAVHAFCVIYFIIKNINTNKSSKYMEQKLLLH